VVFDSSQQITEEDMQILSEVKSVPHLIAVNKIDIKKYELDGEIKEETVVRVSAKTGEGLDVLKKAIIQPFLTNSSEGEGFLITDARHADLINRAILEIRESIGLLDKKVSEEMVLVGLHNALRLLGQITGEVTTEDILTKIFSTFCIGK
jgi:tRNA modification GTPase